MEGNFTIAFFNKSKERLLLLPSFDVYQSISTVLSKYNLKDVSFINVFRNDNFIYRLYVRKGMLMPHRGLVYDLSKDRYLKSKLISDKPVLQFDRLKNMAQSRPGFFRGFDNY